MSTEYRFLRFEIVGLLTVLFFVLGIIPFLYSHLVELAQKDVVALLTVFAGIFIVSQPLGYIEHQYVVNIYRSHNRPRKVHKIIEEMILEIQKQYKGNKDANFLLKLDCKSKVAFLAILFDFLTNIKTDKGSDVQRKLSNRWSHFYARKAVGGYAPIFSSIFYDIFIILAIHLKWSIDIELGNLIFSWIIWFVIIGICIGIIDSYSEKIWIEINHLEVLMILDKKSESFYALQKIIKYLIEHPEYLEKKGEMDVLPIDFN